MKRDDSAAVSPPSEAIASPAFATVVLPKDDEGFTPEQLADLAKFEQARRGNANVMQPTPRLSDFEAAKRLGDPPSYEKKRGTREATDLRTLVDATRGLRVPARVDLDEGQLGVALAFTGLVPRYAGGAPVPLSPSLRDIVSMPLVAHTIDSRSAKHTPPEPPTDPEVLKRCARAASDALFAFFRLAAIKGFASPTAGSARPELAPSNLLRDEAIDFAHGEYGLDMLTAEKVVVASAREARCSIGAVLAPRLDIERPTCWEGHGIRKIEAEVTAEREALARRAAARVDTSAQRFAPATVTKTPRELGALVLTRPIGEREATLFRSNDQDTTLDPLTIRDGRAFLCFALPVLRDVGGAPDGLIIEQQIGPTEFRPWNVVPSDEAVGLSALDVKRIETVLAPRQLFDQLRRRMQSAPNVQASIDRAELTNLSAGIIEMGRLKRRIREFIHRNERALTIDDREGIYLGLLLQGLVVGMKIDPIIVAGELARAARKIGGITPAARDWASRIFERNDDGDRWLLGGPARAIAPGSLLEKKDDAT